ncbi:MAG: DUF3822 family protein, partial [Bacteroidota bacterium]
FLFQGQELLFANAMSIQSPDDVVYYVLMVFNQYNLSKDKQLLQVSGDLLENSDYHRALYRYIKYIKPTASSVNYTYSEANRRQLEKHHFFDLMSVALCS